MIDRDAGAILCNQCFRSDNGDGFAALMWWTGMGFHEALKSVAEFCGVKPLNDGGKKKIDPAKDLEFRPWNDSLIALWCLRKKPIKPEAIKAVGGRLATYKKRWTVIALPVCGVDLDHSKPVGWVIYAANGGSLPVWDKDGKIVEQVKIKTMPGTEPGLIGTFQPGQEPRKRIVKTEGPSDLLALISIGQPEDETACCNIHGCKENPAKISWLKEFFSGHDVTVIHDADQEGLIGAAMVGDRPGWATYAAMTAASCRLAKLPFEIVPNHGKDLRDFFAEGATREDFDRLVEQAEVIPSDPRPEIELLLDESRVVARVLPALGQLGWTLCSHDESLRTYQRSGTLVHVVADPAPVAEIHLPAGTRRIRPLPASLLRERVGASCRLYTGEEERRDHRPPTWLISMLHERGEWPRNAIKPLSAIVSAPTMRPDGSIVQDGGYDERTGLLLDLAGEWPRVAEHPTRDDAAHAAAELLDVITDFPFVGSEHRSGWLAFVLTLVGRPAIAGPVPLFLVDANTRGSGKSLAADCVGIIATGSRLPRKTWSPDDSEIRKTITATALEALSVVLFDNVAGRLGSASLDAALTAISWADRILGQSRTTGTLSLATVWAATGNNVELAADTARRTLLMRLESQDENPEERTGFRHRDLLAWVTEHRRRLAVAALTMLRAYVVSGRPSQGLPPWGSYEAWSDLIRSAIVWAGLADPAETRTIAREADRSADLLRMVILAIRKASKATSAELVRLATVPLRPDEEDPYPEIRAAVAELCGDKITPARLGAKLRGYVGRVWDGWRLVRALGRTKIAAWDVEEVVGSVAGDAGDAGDVFSSFAGERNTICQYRQDSVGNGVPLGYAHAANRNGLETSPASPASPACTHSVVIEVVDSDGWTYPKCEICGSVLSRPKKCESKN